MPKVPFRDNEDVAVIHEPNYHFIGILLVDYNAIVLVVDAPFEDGRISHVVDSVGIKQRVLRQPAASLHQFALHSSKIFHGHSLQLADKFAQRVRKCNE